MQQVTPTGARLLAASEALQPPVAAGDRTASAIRARGAHGRARPIDASPDVIDVEVLWEDGEEAYAPPVEPPRTPARAYRGTPTPLRLSEPGVAIAAYRSAA